MLYSAGRRLFHFALREFFSSIRVVGAPLVEQGSLLVCGNHPNQMMDPLIVDASYKRPLWYLAKAPLFANPLIGAFLKAVHLVPIYRRQDKADMSKNADSFRVACERLAARDAVAIFPEGTSMGEMRLLPLKTGVARIAFQAELLHGWSLGLQIQPLGITYADMYRFRSSVTVTAAEPISVAAFREHYERDEREAVDALIGAVEERLRAVTVDLRDQVHAELVDKVSRLYQSVSSADDRERMKLIVDNLEQVGAEDETRRALEERLDLYLEAATAVGLEGDEKLSTLHGPFPGALTLAGVGALLSWLPYRVVGEVARRIAHEPVYVASTKFVGGMIAFPLWFLLIAMLAGSWLNSWMLGIVTFLLCAFLALMANRYVPQARLALISWIWPGGAAPVEILTRVRDKLIRDIESVRKL